MTYQERIKMLERNREQCQADKAAKRITAEQYRIRHRDVVSRLGELRAEMKTLRKESKHN